jgi:hypothetical protein
VNVLEQKMERLEEMIHERGMMMTVYGDKKQNGKNK